MGSLLEMALHAQMLLCGPNMPVFGLEAASRNLMLMRTFSIQADTPTEAVAALQSMCTMVQQWRTVTAAPSLVSVAASQAPAEQTLLR